MNTTLVIMAAGLGSRYGGNKQIDRIGPHGEILLEYSIYDALAAGFDKVVFIIKRGMEENEVIKSVMARLAARGVEGVCVVQEYANLPGGFTPPAERTKPYGTVHAVYSAKDAIHEPFAVINADDYYGRDAFEAMARQLKSMGPDDKHAAMVGYQLRNTVSENGHVTRGVCQTENGRLVKVVETYKIQPCPDGTIRDLADGGEGTVLPPDVPVSMNFWGFTPWFFAVAESHLTAFLEGSGDPMTKEYALPTLVDQLMHEENLPVDVLTTPAVWFGVTYQQDKPFVAEELKKLHDSGFYPPQL